MITFVAFFYFLFLYFILKYQFLFVFVPVFETGSKFWFGLFDNVMYGLMISVITLKGYIGIKEGVKQAPCLLPLPFIIYYTWKKIVMKFEKRSLHVPFTVAVELDKKASSLEASSEAL